MIEYLTIPDVWTFAPRRFEDARGWFYEAFSTATLATPLRGVSFVQDNQSLSRIKGTLRGLHFQRAPRSQDKLVRVLRGSILDVAVDLRRASPTFGKWVSVVLSADNLKQVFVPKGFAHGFLTLESDTEVSYKVSDFYSREHEGGVAWDDPSLAIEWGIGPEDVVMADRDRNYPRVLDLEETF